MLWRLLEYPLHRYLLSTDRYDGHEKAMRHIEISKILWEVEHVKTASGADHDECMAVHDLIADKVTNHLDKAIGFEPGDDQEWDWDILADRLFKKIIRLDFKNVPAEYFQR